MLLLLPYIYGWSAILIAEPEKVVLFDRIYIWTVFWRDTHCSVYTLGMPGMVVVRDREKPLLASSRIPDVWTQLCWYPKTASSSSFKGRPGWNIPRLRLSPKSTRCLHLVRLFFPQTLLTQHFSNVLVQTGLCFLPLQWRGCKSEKKAPFLLKKCQLLNSISPL